MTESIYLKKKFHIICFLKISVNENEKKYLIIKKKFKKLITYGEPTSEPQQSNCFL